MDISTTMTILGNLQCYPSQTQELKDAVKTLEKHLANEIIKAINPLKEVKP